MAREKSDYPAEVVETPGVLSGDPRLKGHRIGVYHIWAHRLQGDSAEEIEENVYPHLRLEQVEEALRYAREHKDEMREEKQEREELEKELRREAREDKQQALGQPCPECGGDLVGNDQPPALVECADCDEVYVVDQLLDD